MAPSIEQRIAALEAQLAALRDDVEAGGEALQPTYLTINPNTGLVGADFTGLVNALGLIIPAGSVFTPTPVNRIEWQRQSDGAVVADLYGVESGTTDVAAHRALATAAGNTSNAIFGSYDDQGNQQATISTSQTNRGASAEIDVQLGNTFTPRLVDKAGNSSWVSNPGFNVNARSLAIGTGSFVGNATNQQGFGVASTGIGRTVQAAVAVFSTVVTAFVVGFQSSGADGAAWTAFATSGVFSNTFTYQFVYLAIG